MVAQNLINSTRLKDSKKTIFPCDAFIFAQKAPMPCLIEEVKKALLGANHCGWVFPLVVLE